MRSIKTLDELTLPDRHRKFIENYIENVSRFDCIEQIILFGSCAKGTATEKSDVDIFVITSEDIPEALEFEIIFDNVPDLTDGYVESDILLKSREVYNKYKNVTGMVQKAVEREGVDLSGLLSIGNR